MTEAEIETMERAVRYYAMLLKSMCKEATNFDCQDLAQEIRFRVFMQLQKGEKPNFVNRYIFNTAFFAYSKFLRKYIKVHSREKFFEVEAEDNGIDKLIHADTARQIRDAVEKIKSAKNREICRQYFAGVKKSEIARTFGLSKAMIQLILVKEMGPVWVKYKYGEL